MYISVSFNDNETLVEGTPKAGFGEGAVGFCVVGVGALAGAVSIEDEVPVARAVVFACAVVLSVADALDGVEVGGVLFAPAVDATEGWTAAAPIPLGVLSPVSSGVESAVLKGVDVSDLTVLDVCPVADSDIGTMTRSTKTDAEAGGGGGAGSFTFTRARAELVASCQLNSTVPPSAAPASTAGVRSIASTPPLSNAVNGASK